MRNPKRILLWLAVLVWMGIIFFFSSQTALESSGQSGILIRTILSWFDSSFETLTAAGQELRIEALQHVVRKLAHMSIYAVLGMLCMGALYTHRLKKWHRPCFAVAISVLYAMSDEWHQTMVAGRSGELRDVCIDSGGALLGVLFIFAIYTLMQHKKEKVG